MSDKGTSVHTSFRVTPSGFMAPRCPP
jgi:hypothetical protein